MSNAIYPDLAGLKPVVTYKPAYKTLIATSASGKESRVALRPGAVWTITLAYEVLRAGDEETELQTLVAFFKARQGAFDSFLLNDPDNVTGLGVQIRVRFKNDETEFGRFLKDLWEAKKVELVTVL